MENKILIIIITICIITILFSIIKDKSDVVVNFLLRLVFGTGCLYLINILVKLMNYNFNIGINQYTILLNALFGLPGFLLIFGLYFYFM